MTAEEIEEVFGVSNSGNGAESTGRGDSVGVNFEMSAAWQGISERMQVDLETFGKQRGLNPRSMTQNLAAVNREKYDYAAFLKKFAVTIIKTIS